MSEKKGEKTNKAKKPIRYIFYFIINETNK